MTTIFDIPDTNENKKKWLTLAATYWTNFKSFLTTTYIYGDGDRSGFKNPVERYNFLDEETWSKFVKSRMENPEFEVIRENMIAKSAKNLYPHTLSRGGYPKLKETQKVARLKQVGDDGNSMVDAPPSPDRYEMWPKARVKKKTGEYSNEATSKMVERIDSLAEQSEVGTFVSVGRDDILTVALGKAKHPGSVRTAGKGIGLKVYYGGSMRGSSKISKECKDEISAWVTENVTSEVTRKVTDEVTQKVTDDATQRVMMLLAGQQIQIPQEYQDIASLTQASRKKVSTNGSNSPSKEKVNVHRQLGQIAWKLPNGFICIPMDHLNEVSCSLDTEELCDLAVSRKWLADSHITFWFQYLYRVVLEKDYGPLYGFIDPYYYARYCDRGKDILAMQRHIQRQITDPKNPKKCYIGAYSTGYQLANKANLQGQRRPHTKWDPPY